MVEIPVVDSRRVFAALPATIRSVLSEGHHVKKITAGIGPRLPEFSHLNKAEIEKHCPPHSLILTEDREPLCTPQCACRVQHPVTGAMTGSIKLALALSFLIRYPRVYVSWFLSRSSEIVITGDCSRMRLIDE